MFWQEIKEAHQVLFSEGKEENGRSVIFAVIATSILRIWSYWGTMSLPASIAKEIGKDGLVFIASMYLYLLWRAPFVLRRKDKEEKSEREKRMEITATAIINEFREYLRTGYDLEENQFNQWECQVNAAIERIFSKDSYQYEVYSGRTKNADVESKLLGKMGRDLSMSGERKPRSFNRNKVNGIEFKLMVLEWIVEFLTPLTSAKFRIK